MAEFLQALDPSKLVLVGTVRAIHPSILHFLTSYQGVAFLMSPFTAPPYNLPIFLFGTIAQEVPEASRSLTTVRLELCCSLHFPNFSTLPPLSSRRC
jgi:hypothetical protein